MKSAKPFAIVLVLWTCSCVTEGDSSTDNKVPERYFEMDPVEDTYSFGYDIPPNGPFHHENRARDGVTYGCYGHVDPSGKCHTTHYIADSRGYRVVQPLRSAIIFTRTANSRRIRGELRSWEDLAMPEGCGPRRSSTQSDILGGLLGGIPPVVGTITDTATGLVNGTIGGLIGVATTPAVTIPPVGVTTPVSTGSNATVDNNSTSVASSVSSG